MSERPLFRIVALEYKHDASMNEPPITEIELYIGSTHPDPVSLEQARAEHQKLRQAQEIGRSIDPILFVQDFQSPPQEERRQRQLFGQSRHWLNIFELPGADSAFN